MKFTSILTASLALSLPAGLAAAGDDAPTAEQKELLAQLPQFQQPEVWFGDKAPELSIAKWIKGEPVSEFESGRVYVVEFWATWCGPCVRAFPHLSEVQHETTDNVTVIGVNIWDTNDGESQADRAKRVAKFVEEQGENMRYTVALEDGETMAQDWMKAAGQNGIPCAFIVDQKGDVAWIGHPMGIDEPLREVIAGTYDLKPAAAEAAKGAVQRQHYNYVMNEIKTGDANTGYALAVALAETEWADEAQMLNAIAWSTLTGDGIPRNSEASLKIAKKACEATNFEDPGILDTLARACFDNGDYDAAVKYQTMAVDAAPDQFKQELTGALEQYKAAANKG